MGISLVQCSLYLERGGYKPMAVSYLSKSFSICQVVESSWGKISYVHKGGITWENLKWVSEYIRGYYSGSQFEEKGRKARFMLSIWNFAVTLIRLSTQNICRETVLIQHTCEHITGVVEQVWLIRWPPDQYFQIAEHKKYRPCTRQYSLVSSSKLYTWLCFSVIQFAPI